MSSITAEVARHIRTNPDLVTSRGDYLFGLLCTSNRFLSWVDGKPVNTREPAIEDRPVFNREERLANVEAWVNVSEERKASARADIERLAQIVSEAEERATDLTLPDWQGEYGQYPNALIFNLPEDISPEWAVEVERFRAFLTDQHGWTFTDEFIQNLKSDTRPTA